MEEFLAYILSHIADNEKDIVITKEEEGDITRFNVKLHEADYPHVIGKRGLTIKAITDLLRLHDAKNTTTDDRRKIFINIQDQETI